MSSVPRLPNLVFLGPDKAGSTWLYQLLDWHPQAFVPPAKEMFFFDRYFDRGVDWYARQYADVGRHELVVADISHDYLFSSAAPVRIMETLE